MKLLKSANSKGIRVYPYFLITLIILSACNSNNGYSPVESPTVLSSTIPVDVNPEVRKKLITENNIYELNERYNLFSWQAFVAINWPVNDKGEPLDNFTDKGDPNWINWKEAFQVYREDGKKPAPWRSPRTASGLKLDDNILSNSKKRVILQTKTPTHPDNFNIADEKNQAFAGELFDQKGNLVVYEVLMNKEEFDYIVQNNLYNQNGQIDFYNIKGDANFPKGDYGKNELGAIEIKFAWKQLTDDDIKERYFISEGCIWDADSKKCSETVQLGMIGMHISQKTPSGKQWVWSTFEHVDNLVEKSIDYQGENVRIKPSLYNPDCEICPVNVDYTSSTNSTKYVSDGDHGNYFEVTTVNQKGKITGTAKYYTQDSVIKTQAKRMINIPPRVKYINDLMQQYFAQVGSVWQYYMLIDTQYPLDQDVPPGNHTQAGYYLPSSVTNKPGGNPNISFLTNITMETFFQKGNQSAGNLIEGNVTSDINIFGTESCMGCHSSAGIYSAYRNDSIISAGQLSADFSWLMGRANWEEGVPKPNN